MFENGRRQTVEREEVTDFALFFFGVHTVRVYHFLSGEQEVRYFILFEAYVDLWLGKVGIEFLGYLGNILLSHWSQAIDEGLVR